MAYGTCGNFFYASPSGPPNDSCVQRDTTGGGGALSGGPNGGGVNRFQSFTGNAHRRVMDMTVWGSVGECGLFWERFHNTRFTEGTNYFGTGGNWKHIYQWEMVDTVDYWNRPIIAVYVPDGSMCRFWNVNGVWWSAQGATDRLFQTNTTYVMQTQKGWRYVFERLGGSPGQGVYQLQYFMDSQDNTYAMSYTNYNGNTLLSTVMEPAGRKITITYDTLGTNGAVAITKVESDDGRSVTYQYAAYTELGVTYQQLTNVTYLAGTQTTGQAVYEYSHPSAQRPLLEHAVDPRVEGGAVNIKYEYDTGNPVWGFIKRELNGLSGDWLVNLATTALGADYFSAVISYPNNTSRTVETGSGWQGFVHYVTDTLGKTTAYSHDNQWFLNYMRDARGLETHWTKSQYDNPLWKSRGFGNDWVTESWTRDSLDLATSHTVTVGGQNRVTTYTRGDHHRVTQITHPDGTSEQFQYNSFGQVTWHKQRNGGEETFLYDSRGLKTNAVDALGNVTVYAYDSRSLLQKVTDPRGNETFYEHNDRGQATKIQYGSGGPYKEMLYDDYGNKWKEIDELGHTWTWQYDVFRRPTSATDPRPGMQSYPTLYSYGTGASQCGSCSTDNKPTLITLPSGKKTLIVYDSEGRKIIETAGYQTADAATTTFGYGSTGNLLGVTNALGQGWGYLYDNHNRLWKATDPLGRTTEWTYDAAGNKLTETRPDGGVTQFTYDVMNRLTSTTDPAGKVTTMAYDNSDNLVSLTDAKGNTYRYTYDLLNRRTVSIYPDGSRETFTYDATGNLIRYTTRAGQTIAYTYDNRNRRTQMVTQE